MFCGSIEIVLHAIPRGKVFGLPLSCDRSLAAIKFCSPQRHLLARYGIKLTVALPRLVGSAALTARIVMARFSGFAGMVAGAV